MIVYKYTFAVDYRISIQMPADAKILMIDVQFGVPCMWALVDPAKPMVQREFLIVGTGHPVPPSGNRHVGSFQQPPFVWHVFEKA
jgi:hypothetical protein